LEGWAGAQHEGYVVVRREIVGVVQMRGGDAVDVAVGCEWDEKRGGEKEREHDEQATTVEAEFVEEANHWVE
jgi:hypothetical protein